jgi:hypothetical protein
MFTYSLCPYAKWFGFGEPGKGMHKWGRQFGGIAWLDVLMTIAGGAVCAFVFGWSYWNTIVCFFLLAILIHRAFCVRTTVDKWIFY